MNPRESTLILAAAQLLNGNRDTAYGPAHAVRDALEIETEVSRQVLGAISQQGTGGVSELTELYRKMGAV